GLAALELHGFEADDLIATYARMGREAGSEVTIVSSDKDLMQLVDDRVTMLDPMKMANIGPSEVHVKFGVPPEKVVDVQALAGDAVDNVPGVPGIGVKTAALLINEYGDLETLLARAEEIKQPKRRQNLIEFADQARISRRLVELDKNAPVTATLAEMATTPPDPETLLNFLRAQSFRTLTAKVEARFVDDGRIETAAPSETASVETSYELVQSLEALDRWVAEATAQGFVAVDTETTSLDAQQANLVGVSLAVKPGKACYIPLAHRSPGPVGELDLGGAQAEQPTQIPMADALARLKPLLEDPTVLKIGQNLKYDMAVLARYDVSIAPLDDCMLLSFVLDAGLHGHGMDELARLHLDHETIKFADVCGKGKDRIGFDEVALDKALHYAAEDADITLRLYNVLKPRLAAERMAYVYERIERPLAATLAGIEAEGVLVDKATLARLSKDFGERMASLEIEIHKLAGREFNVGSPKQLGEILFDEMSLSGGKKGKTGAWSTDSTVLETLAARGHDLPARVLDWRQVQKLKSTYADALQTYINPRTGRIHTSFSMAGAATGRLASSDPNLQNIPIRTEEGRKLRGAFTVPDGSLLLSADYSQIELRLLAHVADIPELKKAFDAGLDIHASTAALVFGGEAETIDPALRRQAKAINFGIIYGISPFGLARQLQVPQGDAKA
ncbi:MAG: DNA polymerase I, partial [Alphaproteobacteria bacterium]